MSTTTASVLLPSPNKLKRTATAASLPTPPRTQRRRRRSSIASDSDRARSSDTASDDELPVKKRRLATVQEDDDQDAFWLGKTSTPPGTVATLKTAASKSDGWSSSDEEEVPLLTRRKANSDAASDYASPPPSHRKPAKLTLATVKTPSPKTRRTKTAIPIRDSPNNPFLDSPPASASTTNASPGIAEEADKDGNEEEGDAMYNVGDKPTVAFVHRGVRRQFPNPYHDPKTGRARPVNPNSLLPPEHEDYEPDFRCIPKVLFPGTEGKKRVKKRATERPALRRSATANSSDEDKSPKSGSANPLLMAPGPRQRRRKVDDSW